MTTTTYSHFTTQRLQAQVAVLEEMKRELDSRASRVAQEAPVSEPVEKPVYDGWLSSAGVARNGGIRAPGQEGMKASTGTPKSAPKKATKMASPYCEPTRPVPADKPITKGKIIAEGIYQDGDKIVRVRKAQAGHLYGLVWDGTEFKFVSGAMRGMTSDMRVTLEQASEFGKTTGTCMMCGRELTNPESISRGIGPICASRF